LKMLLDKGQVTLIEVPPSRAAQLKKGGRMQWDRNRQAFTASASLGLLEYLAGMFTLPGPYMQVLERMRRSRAAAEEEQARETPVALVHYPVKRTLYAHQVRAANMALLDFGIVEPGEGGGDGNRE